MALARQSVGGLRGFEEAYQHIRICEAWMKISLNWPPELKTQNLAQTR